MTDKKRIDVKRWLLVARNTAGGADFVLDPQYMTRRQAQWNKKRLKLERNWKPVRFRITEVKR